MTGAQTMWAIGDPGRAATEVPPGRPPAPAGHADIEIGSFAFGGMQGHAATVRGILHRRAGEPRQDGYALSSRVDDIDEEYLIAVVCDGVGSLARSHEAADFVSSMLATAAAAGHAWPEAIDHANSELKALAAKAAEADGDGPGGMATTAVALAVRLDGDEWVGDVAWVGDSPCWHLSDSGEWSQVTRQADDDDDDDDDDEFYTGSVRPLPSSDGVCEGVSFRVRGGALFLMTDGVANPMKWSAYVQDTLAEWWAAPPDALTFAGQVGFARKTHMDDRTAVGIWRQSPPSDSDSPPQLTAAAMRRNGSAAAPVDADELGQLEPLAEGAFGRVYTVPGFRLPGENDELAYKEFTANHAEQARSARAVVGLWDKLDPRERVNLARHAAWPRALVQDQAGDVRGVLMPLIPRDFFHAQRDWTGVLHHRPRDLQWMIASDKQIAAAGVEERAPKHDERRAILVQLATALGTLHRHGWVYGNLSFSHATFALDPPRAMLLDCDAAARLSDLGRAQALTPFWEPPEAGTQPLQDQLTDVYQLGLAVLRCLTPGRGAATSRDPARLEGVVDESVVALVARAVSADRAQRPSVEEIRSALDGGAP